MSLEVASLIDFKPAPTKAASQLEELVHRVASSETFEKSPRLRAFLVYVCRCALEDKSDEATESQIGIFVYGRAPGYNSTEDNIVRSQARMLRMKLEHHFANEGKDEPVIITIPKGHYLPVFETRSVEQPPPPEIFAPAERQTRPLRWLLVGVAVLFGLAGIWLGYVLFESSHTTRTTSDAPLIASVPQPAPTVVALKPKGEQLAFADDVRDVRIAAGRTGAPFVDGSGHRWGADRYYDGGTVQPGPRHFFPPVAEVGLFRSIREAVSDDKMVPQTERGFRYDIPLSPGVYELRLYFADPLRQADADRKEDAQNERHLQINLNGRPLLVNFDPIADGGDAAVDVRVFKDVRPADDGKLHLDFLDFGTNFGRAFVSALELTPGIPGKLKPIRIAAGLQSDFVDSDRTRWSRDLYFIDGRTWIYLNPPRGPKIPALYTGERHGNFSYSIPVAPGSYTVKLHFLESFFSPLIPAAFCQGAGCRVFDITCNGVMLLEDFDIIQAASGAFQPVVREFHGLHPNGQGKLLLSFSPRVNYAEIRAIEVIDESK
jgi:hypothetical protein